MEPFFFCLFSLVFSYFDLGCLPRFNLVPIGLYYFLCIGKLHIFVCLVSQPKLLFDIDVNEILI